MSSEWLAEATRSLNKAKEGLVSAAIALDNASPNDEFGRTIKEIKENIGDLEITIAIIEGN